MPRILLVEDEKDLAWSICRSLSAAGYETMAAHTGTEALALARRHPPDVFILDIMLPGMDGLSLCRRFKDDATTAAAPVIFLTAKAAVEHRIEGLSLGADDYLAKPFDLRELLARVQALLRRRQRPPAPPADTDLTLGPLAMNGRTRSVRVDGRDVRLTPTEFDLLYHLASHPGEVFSAHDLLQVVWGYAPKGPGSSTDVVRWHIKNVRAKIETDPAQPQFIRNVPSHGYVAADAASETPGSPVKRSVARAAQARSA
jgi:DNA-binding response OmpR family regulator